VKDDKAVVLLSGGQDSATCLAWACRRFKEVHALVLDYGQRHSAELAAAARVASMACVPVTRLEITALNQLTHNALTRASVVVAAPKGQLPTTFVSGRNVIFTTYAAIYAREWGAHHVVSGACQTDYSGYPDCRRVFFDALQTTLALAMDWPVAIHTPLMWLTKAETVKMMGDFGHLDWLAASHTCYEGLRPACGVCPACELRLKGFAEAGVRDPLEYVRRDGV
jgi:7-cyano-7-deazaguanine synthase